MRTTDAVELTLIGFRESGIECDIAVALDGPEALDYIFYSGKFKGRRREMPALVLLGPEPPQGIRARGLEKAQG